MAVDIKDAVQDFIKTLPPNPIYHSVWIGLKEKDGKPYLDPDTDRYEYEIKIAIRPRFRHLFQTIPDRYKDFPVCMVPWPNEV